MLPIIEGIYEWFESDGKRRLVSVCDVSPKKDNSYLRAYWAGGYYDIKDSVSDVYDMGGVWQYSFLKRSEWTGGTWGNRVGDIGSINEDLLYEGLDRA